MMKFILFCGFIAVISAHHHFHQKTPAEIKTAREDCWKELNLSEEQVESMKKYEYPDEVAIHNAVKCTGLKLDLWCEHEGFHKEDLIVQFGEAATPVINKCLTKRNEDDTLEKWAWHDWKCLAENGLKEHFKKLEA
ncbi:uncharacterized protein LOC129611816 [Condylostylus longicornis]|uniref:uncharacterized protein LOC129611816 n=1 Tax=Condylostylus longicornis TaxID=2530218 RepID=UPI00244E32AD|nr:uncharacterized protein LOC129611816 [Condylostylus longicornis]